MISIILFLVAIVCEFVDSFLGMMYGTILTPALILFGHPPADIVPCILLSQAIGGFVASYRHYKLKNISLDSKSTDFKVALLILSLGIIAVFFGVLVGIRISPFWLNTYIGILCICMGLLVFLNRVFKFSWKKIGVISLISSFNKAFSGGGFGPIVVSGQIVSGREGKSAIGTTDLAKAPICLTAFLMWVFCKGIPPIHLLIPLLLGAIIGGYMGPFALSRFQSKTLLTKIVGCLVVFLGALVLLKTWL